MGHQRDRVGAELGPGDLQDDADDALPDLGRRAVHLGAAVGVEHDARRTRVVEALRVADVLEPDREPDPAPDTFAARRVAGAAGQPDRVARQLLGRGHRDRGGGANRLGHRARALDHLARRQRIAGAERVQEAQLDRVDLELGRQEVHLRLGGEARLHGAEAAHRATRRVVRVHRRRLDQRVVDAIRADRERCGVRRDGGRARRVGAAVEQDPHPHVDEAPVARGAVLAPHPRGVPVDMADERLLAVVDDLHRPARVEREQSAVQLHREVLAPAERAADPREVDPHLLGREPEAGRHLVAVDVQPLRGDVDVDTTFAVRDGQTGLGAEEGLVLDADVVDAGDGHVSLGVGIAVADHEVPDDVRARVVAIPVPHRRPVGMERLRLGGALHLGDHRQLLVDDADRLGRPPRLLGMLGRNERDRLAVVADAVGASTGWSGNSRP